MTATVSHSGARQGNDLFAELLALTPDPDTTVYYKRLFRIYPNADIHAWGDDARWRWKLAFAEAGEYPRAVTINSALICLSIIDAADGELRWREQHGLSRGPVKIGIPNEVLDDIRQRLSLADEVARTVELRFAGDRLKGLCPFHSERTPSFVVFDDHAHCFGCSWHGDLFAWVQAIERIDFKEAVEQLAARAGVSLPTKKPKKPKNTPRLRGTTGI